MNHFLLAQISGAIAVAFSLLLYQFNSRRTMLILDMCGNLFWIITFLQLRAPTGLSMVVIGALTCLIFIKIKPTKENIWILVLILTAIVIATLWTWSGAIGLLAMGGSVLYTVRFWTTSTTVIRRVSLLAAPLWFAYDVIIGNYPGAFIEVVGTGSNLLGQYRFDIKSDKTTT